MNINEKLTLLPDSPGVYLFENPQGEIIYVGKAASLKNRVRSYFHALQTQPPKVQLLVKNIANFSYVVTENEVEALILECNLIKKHRPKYNINLKDDKSYPYLKLTVGEDYPRLAITRQKKNDGSRYFGPFTNVGALKETLRIVRSLFPVRVCKETPLKLKIRPCLNADLRRCQAPCTGKVERESYRHTVEELILFFEGKQTALVQKLEKEMQAAAANLEFERAALLRDRLFSLRQVLTKQRIISARSLEADVVALAQEGQMACAQIFFIREGKLTGQEHFFLNGEALLEEVLAAFLKQYYHAAENIPAEIILPQKIKEEEIIRCWLSQKRGGKVTLSVPARGEKQALLNLAAKNAKVLLTARESNRQKEREQLLLLQKELGLPRLPARIECYDISNLGGNFTVGSLVVFENGRPAKKLYRKFKVKTVSGPDDYASLREVLKRRFEHAPGEELPDLILIDGGRGQLHAAQEALRACGREGIPVYALAKQEEELFGSGSPYPLILPRQAGALHLLQRLRDEAHRFALAYHRQLREKEARVSVLDGIYGIGPQRKRKILQTFGSLEKIKTTCPEEIAREAGIPLKIAEKLRQELEAKI